VRSGLQSLVLSIVDVCLAFLNESLLYTWLYARFYRRSIIASRPISFKIRNTTIGTIENVAIIAIYCHLGLRPPDA